MMAEVQAPVALPGHRADTLSIMVTRRCTMTCGHCSVESSPRVAELGPGEDDLRRWLHEAAAAGVRAVNFTGGEPMVRERLVIALMREARGLGLVSALTTNGFWGRKPGAAARTLDGLLAAGLARLTVSYDRYHAEFQGPEPARNIVEAARDRGLTVHINVTRMQGDSELDRITAPFSGYHNVMLRFYDLQPVGFAAKGLAGEDWRDNVEGFCNACDSPAISDDGRLMACNGPAYFKPDGHPLQLGRLGPRSVQELVARHTDDPILDTIRTFGPARLREELLQLPEAGGVMLRDRYRGLCDLCLHLTDQPEAMQALRQRLAMPDRVAEREAKRLLIRSERRKGQLSPAYVNSAGIARLIHQALWTDRATGDWLHGSEHLLGRSDLDWQRVLLRLRDAGLCRAARSLMEDPAVRRWAPGFMAERLRAWGEAETLRELGQRVALRRLAGGGDGPRLIVLSPVDGRRVDRFLDCAVVSTDRGVVDSAMRQAGFQPLAADRAGFSVWRAPDQGTRVRLRRWSQSLALPHQRFVDTCAESPGLWRLSAEGQILHALLDHARRGFGEGSRAAWDVEQALRADPGLREDDRLRQLLAGCPGPKAAWTSLQALERIFGLGLERLCRQAPDVARDQRLLLIAVQRSCHSPGTDAPLDRFSARGIDWLMADGWTGRLHQSLTALADLVQAGRASEQPAVALRRQVRAARARYRDFRALRNRAADLQRY